MTGLIVLAAMFCPAVQDRPTARELLLAVEKECASYSRYDAKIKVVREDGLGSLEEKRETREGTVHFESERAFQMKLAFVPPGAEPSFTRGISFSRGFSDGSPCLVFEVSPGKLYARKSNGHSLTGVLTKLEIKECLGDLPSLCYLLQPEMLLKQSDKKYRAEYVGKVEFGKDMCDLLRIVRTDHFELNSKRAANLPRLDILIDGDKRIVRTICQRGYMRTTTTLSSISTAKDPRRAPGTALFDPSIRNSRVAVTMPWESDFIPW